MVTSTSRITRRADPVQDRVGLPIEVCHPTPPERRVLVPAELCGEPPGGAVIRENEGSGLGDRRIGDRNRKLAVRRLPLLAGQVVIVTGASSGIGGATARRLVRAGAKVVISARRADRRHVLEMDGAR